MTPRIRLTSCLLSACIGFFPCRVSAQLTGHYPPGSEGIEAGSLPPPGFYLLDYNYIYRASQLSDGTGTPVPLDFRVTAYANVVRPLWMTKLKILGATYGMDVAVPFVHTALAVAGVSASDFGVGDVLVEPLDLAWRLKKGDLGFAYGLWTPTGRFDRTRPAEPGKGFLSHMITVGGTWFPAKERRWALSALNRYEIHTQNSDLHVTPGHTDTVEWGISKTMPKSVDLGLVGYYQQEITHDTGEEPGTVPQSLYKAVASGPEVKVFVPHVVLFLSIRYLHEFTAVSRAKGNTVVVTLTKPL